VERGDVVKDILTHGSITIQAVVNLYGPDGTQWGHGDVVIRLTAFDAQAKAWAKAKRKETP
jgi:hypothetical protein